MNAKAVDREAPRIVHVVVRSGEGGGRAYRERVVRDFSLERMAPDHATLYATLLARRRPAAAPRRSASEPVN